MNVDQKIETPEPEGLDTGASDGWGDYPLDAVFVRTEPRMADDKRAAKPRRVIERTGR
jgi:hypothetical protein